MLHSCVDTEEMLIIATSFFHDGVRLYQSLEIYIKQNHNIQLVPKFKTVSCNCGLGSPEAGGEMTIGGQSIY